MLIIDVISICLVIIILIIIIVYLNHVNRKLNQRIKQEKNRFILYKNRLWELEAKQALTKKDLEMISKLARDFFKERFNLNYNLSYVELSQIFKKEGLDERLEFCDKMLQILYAGEKVDTKEIKKMITLLLSIIEDYKYI